MTRFVLAVALIAAAPSAPAADPAKLDHAAVGRLLVAAGYNKTDDNGISYLVPVGNKLRWHVDVMLDIIDQSVIEITFSGGKLPAKGYDPDLLVRMLKENTKRSAPFFGLTRDGQIVLTTPLAAKTVTADQLKAAITDMAIVAAQTTALWDTTNWPSAPAKK